MEKWEEWLSSTEMAADLGCSTRTLDRLRADGTLLPGAHYHRGFGSRSPLSFNAAAVREALRLRSASMES